jgi:hypothetical protein
MAYALAQQQHHSLTLTGTDMMRLPDLQTNQSFE